MTDFFEDELTEEELTGEFVGLGDVPPPGDEEYDQPRSDFVSSNYRGPVAKKYEKKVKTVLNVVFRQTVARESTVPDAAAILMYGPQFAEKAGDLANKDPRARRAIDMLTEGSDNVYLAFGIAAVPLVLQLWRNHEEILNPKGAVEAVRESRKRAKEREPKRIRIPFTKRQIEFRFQFKLPSLRNLTNEPDALAAHVFSNPDIILAMQKAGIEEIAGMNLNGDSAGQRTSKR
jgi:hypothetical protein